MRDILDDLNQWVANGEVVALATVVSTWGSSPRRVGAKMALTPAGKITGSVSGGCVEAAVFEAGVETLQTGVPQLLKFGVSDDTAWTVGLACGGHVDVFVQPLERDLFVATRRALSQQRPFAIATVIGGPPALLGRQAIVDRQTPPAGFGPGLDASIDDKVRQALAEGSSQIVYLEYEDQTLQFFIEVVKPQPTLVIVGGVHIAIALTSIAATLGYDTVVIDPRRAFGNAGRFPHAGRLMQEWPQEALAQVGLTDQSAVAILTHDPKIDDLALIAALDSPAFYIGALGSRKTQTQRRKRLAAAGVTADRLERIHGPIGIEIGGETPEEIALAIMAEIVASAHNAPVKTAKENRVAQISKQ